MEQQLKAIQDDMAKLVAIPSVSSVQPDLDQGNRGVIDLLAGWLDETGFRCTVTELPNAPHKANLVATLGEGDQGLVLAGHTDTVPHNAELWQSDPFTLTRTDDRLVGLGTCDMKGFFALALAAIRQCDRGRLCQPLTLLATADEESTMAGARLLADSGQLPGRYAVIGEPTNLRPVRLHKGIMMESIHLHGQSGHSSDPGQGNNALEGMNLVLDELMVWRTDLARNHADMRFPVPVPTLNLGHIHGGDNPNRICGDCTLHIDLRPLPGMDMSQLRETLHQRVRDAVEETGLEVSFATLADGIPPMETAADATIVQAIEALTGQEAEAVTYSTEGPFLTRMGLETVILGPGELSQAHQPNESLAIASLAPTVDLLGGLIEQFCATPSTMQAGS